ncbi:MAG: hypothetical protein ABI538_13430 [Pseudoxanthomonas sp.]
MKNWMETPAFAVSMIHSLPLRSCLVALALVPCLHPAPVRAAVDPDGAAMVFTEAKALCEHDGGALWGRSLCGPVLLVDPADRSVIANQADAEGALSAHGGWFTGVLPASVTVANTPTEWSGTRWTQLLWPVDFDGMIRHVTLAHELFHRIQPALGLSRPEAGNGHLDTLEGRYLLQLEWRALARALMAQESGDRNARISDALAFRSERQRLFANAASDESALDINEGVPEYTGVRLGLDTPEQRRAYAIFDLSRFVEAPSLVRSFAYAHGPAYGLLLDEVDPTWRTRLASGRSPDQLLAAALPVQPMPVGGLQAGMARYDDGTLRASEVRREQQRLLRLVTYRAALVDGPVLGLPLTHANFRFNPQTLVSLDGIGTIYPTLELSDDWGTLIVEREGALVLADKSRATVPAPAGAPSTRGTGWTLSLNPGWRVVPGARAGDWRVAQDPPH